MTALAATTATVSNSSNSNLPQANSSSTATTTKKSRPKTASPTRHGPQQCQVCLSIYLFFFVKLLSIYSWLIANRLDYFKSQETMLSINFLCLLTRQIIFAWKIGEVMWKVVDADFFPFRSIFHIYSSSSSPAQHTNFSFRFRFSTLFDIFTLLWICECETPAYQP